MKLQPIVERVEAEVPMLRYVDAVAGLAMVGDRPLAPKSAYIAPVSENAEDNSRVGPATRQVVRLRFAVVLILGAQARDRDRVNEDLEAFTAAIKRALIGWVHPDAIAETTYRAGRLLRAADGQLAWQMDFETRQQEATP